MSCNGCPPIDLTAAEAIHGWMPRNELQWLAEQAQQAKRILEIGAWQGRSTRALYDHLPERGKVTTVDTWAGDERDPPAARKGRAHYQMYAEKGSDAVFNEFCERHSMALAFGKLRPMRMPSAEALRQLYDEGEEFDFIFIDGCHQYAAVAEDIEGAYKVLAAGGLLSGHDYLHRGHPGVKRAVDECFANRFALHGAIWYLRPDA